jgi:hypothetical protein
MLNNNKDVNNLLTKTMIQISKDVNKICEGIPLSKQIKLSQVEIKNLRISLFILLKSAKIII